MCNIREIQSNMADAGRSLQQKTIEKVVWSRWKELVSSIVKIGTKSWDSRPWILGYPRCNVCCCGNPKWKFVEMRKHKLSHDYGLVSHRQSPVGNLYCWKYHGAHVSFEQDTLSLYSPHINSLNRWIWWMTNSSWEWTVGYLIYQLSDRYDSRDASEQQTVPGIPDDHYEYQSLITVINTFINQPFGVYVSLWYPHFTSDCTREQNDDDPIGNDLALLHIKTSLLSDKLSSSLKDLMLPNSM